MMNVNNILTQLVKTETCFPAIKLVWDSQFEFEDLTKIPKIFPSDFVRELQLNTLERHNLLCHQQRKLEFWKPGVDVTVVPCVVAFQNYKTGEKHSVDLLIRNISKKLQKITLLMDESHAFEVDVDCNRITSLASGMTVTATVNFSPDDDRDYYHKLVIATKNSRFAVPILGIGGRGILDLPDKFDFKRVPVKCLKSKTTTVTNLGTKSARFTFMIDGPFRVTPEKGVVAPRDSFNLSICFIAETQGIYEGYLKIKYENGEELHSLLKAEAINVCVDLSSERITFEDTYAGFKSKEIVRIVNYSNSKINFCWKKFESKASFHTTLMCKLTHNELGHGDMHPLNLENQENFEMTNTKGLQPELMSAGDIAVGHSEPVFSHTNFTLEPSMGQIPPRGSVNINLFFSPNSPHFYFTEAFCDLSGLEERLPLLICGRGLGPKFRFGFDNLKIGTIYLGGVHGYEIPVENISHINGEVVFDSVCEHMENISVSAKPKSIELAPGQFGAFYLYITCGGIPRELFEEVRFRVPVTNEFTYIGISGTITFPGLRFSPSQLDFGEVSCGFAATEEVILLNDCLNPIDIVLKLNTDGKDPALCSDQIIESFGLDQVEFPEKPQEFQVTPSSFQLAPSGVQRIRITLLPNTYGDYNRKLIVYISGNNDPIYDLSITAQAPIPPITNPLGEIVLQNCYVGFPYPQNFEINNPTTLTGVYCIVPLLSEEYHFDSKEFVGVLNPRGKTTVPFTITSLAPGKMVAYVEVYLVGNSESLLELGVAYTSILPKLKVNRKVIDFGSVKLLEPSQQVLEIINESPIPIPFSIKQTEGGKTGDKWSVRPSIGMVSPQTTLPVTVEIDLGQSGKQNAAIRILQTNTSPHIEVKLKAVGTGSGIRFPPDIDSTGIINFQTMLTKTTKSITFEIKNPGSKPQMLEWRHANDDPPVNPMIPAKKNRNKEPVVKKPKKPQKSHFSINPMTKLLQPGEAVTFTITAYSKNETSAEDKFTLWAILPQEKPEEDTSKDGKGKKRTKMHFPPRDPKAILALQEQHEPVSVKDITFLAVFVAPKLTFSKKMVMFRIDAHPSEHRFEEENSLRIENSCVLPLSVAFQTKFPFSLKTKGLCNGHEHGTNDWSYTFKPKETIIMTIHFDGRHLRKDKPSVYFSSTLDISYVNHPDTAKIPLQGEVNFPSVKMDVHDIDFGIVDNGTEAIEEFAITNECSFDLSYKWYIKPFSTVVQSTVDEVAEKVAKARSKKHRKEATGLCCPDKADPKTEFAKKLQEALDFSKALELKFKLSEKEEDAPKIESNQFHSLGLKNIKSNEESGMSPSVQSIDNYGESVQFLREKIYRAKMMDMVGLHDMEKEDVDPLMYLQKNMMEPKTIGPIGFSELIDIIPMAGTLQAGQTQNFSCVFYGFPNVIFKTIAVCYIEGGTSEYLAISGQSKVHLTQEMIDAMREEAKEKKKVKAQRRKTKEEERKPREREKKGSRELEKKRQEKEERKRKQSEGRGDIEEAKSDLTEETGSREEQRKSRDGEKRKSERKFQKSRKENEEVGQRLESEVGELKTFDEEEDMEEMTDEFDEEEDMEETTDDFDEEEDMEEMIDDFDEVEGESLTEATSSWELAEKLIKQKGRMLEPGVIPPPEETLAYIRKKFPYMTWPENAPIAIRRDAHGRLLMAIFENGSALVFYPHGGVAIVISSSNPWRQVLAIRDPYDKPFFLEQSVLANLDSRGLGTVYNPNGLASLKYNKSRGFRLDGAGDKAQSWNWNQGGQRIVLKLNRFMSLRILDKDNVSLVFNGDQRGMRFRLGPESDINLMSVQSELISTPKSSDLATTLRQLTVRQGNFDFYNKDNPPPALLKDIRHDEFNPASSRM